MKILGLDESKITTALDKKERQYDEERGWYITYISYFSEKYMKIRCSLYEKKPGASNSIMIHVGDLPGEILDALIFTERDGKYYISLEDETLLIDNRDSLGQLIFGSTVQGGEEYSLLQAELADMPKLKDVIDTIFPVPFPWTQNLNYI